MSKFDRPQTRDGRAVKLVPPIDKSLKHRENIASVVSGVTEVC